MTRVRTMMQKKIYNLLRSFCL